LRVIERHTREYSPFEVYVKALAELFRGHELTQLEWEEAAPERGGSRMFPYLDYYQKQGYRSLMKRAREHVGAFLCDGVGLGKTFIGLMVIERLIVYERKRVALIVPKGARDTVWEAANAVHHRLVAEPSLYPWCSAGWFQRQATTTFYKTVMGFKSNRVNAPDDFEVDWPPDKE
jgi:hypothetical protein